MPKRIPKFKVGDKVYIKKRNGVVFGRIARVREDEVLSYRKNRIRPEKLRLSRRMKIRYLVEFEDEFEDHRRKYYPNRISQYIAQSSIKLLPDDESELVRRLMGEDYL